MWSAIVSTQEYRSQASWDNSIDSVRTWAADMSETYFMRETFVYKSAYNFRDLG